MMFGRWQVLQCVNSYMPPMHLKKNLEEGSKQLIDAATTEKEKVDAEKVISKVKPAFSRPPASLCKPARERNGYPLRKKQAEDQATLMISRILSIAE